MAEETVFTVNQALYAREESVRSYVSPTLLPSEVAIFVKYCGEIRHRHVLDLACGAGRTTFYLRHLTRHYTGVDFSGSMLEQCRLQPGCGDLRLIQRDMRRLDLFDDGSFDFVLISANGIDHLEHDDRRAVLVDQLRILRPGGLLVFSAHNRRYLDRRWGGSVPPPGLKRAFDPRPYLRDPVRQIRWLRQTWRSRRNYRRLEGLQHFDAHYSIVVGVAHERGLLSYWIEPPAQVAQLHDIGFELLESYDTYGGSGATIDPFGDTAAHSAVYYVARKPELQPEGTP